MNEQIVQYIRDNRERYTRDAITTALIAAGYEPAEIDEAWGALEVAQPPSKRKTFTGWFWFVLVAYVVGTYAITIAVAAVVPSLTTIVALGLLLAGAIGWGMKRYEDPPFAAGLGCGVIAALGIPFIASAIILGLCVAGVIKGPYGP